ncbi:MAG: TetR/AcrR family transcriptional regulator [Acidobacteriota bacterium]
MRPVFTRKQKAVKKTTSERLLDAAEHLFARQGIRATSLREITELAAINIAAVNYHFHSKDALVRAVYERSFGPLNQERLRLLNEAEAAAGEGPLSIEAVLNALFEPMVREWRENPNFILMIGRLHSEPDTELLSFVLRLYEDLIRRFLAAGARALPGLSAGNTFFWTHFLFGGVVYTFLSVQDLENLQAGHSILDDPEEFLARLIAFGAAGLRAQVEMKG